MLIVRIWNFFIYFIDNCVGMIGDGVFNIKDDVLESRCLMRFVINGYCFNVGICRCWSLVIF